MNLIKSITLLLGRLEHLAITRGDGNTQALVTKWRRELADLPPVYQNLREEVATGNEIKAEVEATRPHGATTEERTILPPEGSKTDGAGRPTPPSEGTGKKAGSSKGSAPKPR